jgi:hypothetical protein
MNIGKLVVFGALAFASLCARAGAAPSGVEPAAGQTYAASDFYNQGNAFAREKQYGLAILSYKRAAVLAPGDADIKANLAEVQALAGLPVQDNAWSEGSLPGVSHNLLYALGVVGLCAAGGGLLLIRFDASRRRVGWISVVGGAALCSISTGDALAIRPTQSEAVILQQTVARISPIAGGEAAFELATGQSVHSKSKYRGFVLVKDYSGQLGWVPRANLAEVVERS